MSTQGMILTVLATQLAEAVALDNLAGHPIDTVMGEVSIGKNVSDWLRDVVATSCALTEVHVAHANYPYEHGEVLGVFATADAAETCRNKAETAGNVGNLRNEYTTETFEVQA